MQQLRNVLILVFFLMTLINFHTTTSYALTASMASNDTSSTCQSDNNGETFCGFAVSSSTITANEEFQSHFKMNVSADNRTDAFSNQTVTGNAAHTVQIDVTAANGEAYTIVINHSWNGDRAKVEDGDLDDCDTNDTGVTGTYTGPGTIVGSLELDNPPDVSSCGSNVNSDPFSDADVAKITATGDGTAQSHTLVFSWSAETISNDGQIAFRLGLDPSGFGFFGGGPLCEICDYDGDPVRTIGDDGHFVNVTIETKATDVTALQTGIDSPRGVAVDSNDNTYVAVSDENRVIKIDVEGNVTTIIDSSGDGTGNALADPRAIAIDSSDNVYVASVGSDNLFKITSAGVITELLDTTTLNIPSGIAIDSSDRIYVASFSSNKVVRVDSNGANVTTLINSSHGLAGPEGVAIDSSDNVYVAGFNSTNVYKITPGGTVTEIINSSGDGTHGLQGPKGVAVDSNSNVYVTGNLSDNVFKYTALGVISQILDSTGDGTNGLSGPGAIAIDSQNHIYVAGEASDNVFQITGGDRALVTCILNADGDLLGNTLNLPSGLALNQSDDLHVSGRFSDNLFKVRTFGRVGVIIDATGDGSGNTLDDPEGIAIDLSENVYVTGHGSNNVLKITPSGTITEIIDGSGDGTNALQGPRAVAVDSTGNVYVGGEDSDNVFKITPGGTITQVLSSDNGPNEPLDRPYDIVIDGTDAAFVVGRASENVFKITSGGSAGEVMDSGDGLNDPIALAVDSNNSLYISSQDNHRVYKREAGGAQSVIMNASDGITFPWALAVDLSDNLYVGEQSQRRLYKIQPDGTKTLLAQLSAFMDNFTTMAVDSDANIYTADFSQEVVLRILSNGSVVRNIMGAPGDCRGNLLENPAAVAVRSDKLYVTSSGAGDVVFKIQDIPVGNDGKRTLGEECDNCGNSNDACNDLCLVNNAGCGSDDCESCTVLIVSDNTTGCSCKPADIGTPCTQDGNFCNGVEACNQERFCVSPNIDPCAGADGDTDCSESCDEVADECSANDPNGSSCGGSSDECDLPDTCSDGLCVDIVAGPGTVCNAADGSDACDVDDVCDGFNAACPTLWASTGTSCGDSSNTECNQPDTCNGAGACLANLEPDGTSCGDTGTECIVQDTCSSGSCQDAGFFASGTSCGSSSDTVCDDPDTCDGSGSCLTNLEPVTTQCRTAAHQCDVAEFCDGANAACPTDVLAGAGTACDAGGSGAADAECEANDECDGSGSCVELFAAAGTSCGDATADACDAADSCDALGTCIDNIDVAGTVCSAAADQCANADGTCDGSSKTCDNGDIIAAGVRCRVTQGACDVAEMCDGVKSTCPADSYLGSRIDCRADEIIVANTDGLNEICEYNTIAQAFSCGGIPSSDPGGGFTESQEVAVGNMDGDENGALDVVFANKGVNELCLGDNMGGFTCTNPFLFDPPGPPTAVPANNDTRSVAVADLNDDGHLDAVFANAGTCDQQGTCTSDGASDYYCLNDGQSPPEFTCVAFNDAMGVERVSEGVALGYVDGDSLLDIVIAVSGVSDGGDRNRLCVGTTDMGGAFTGVSCSNLEAGPGDPERVSRDVVLGLFSSEGDLDAFFANDTPAQGSASENRRCFGDNTGSFSCDDDSNLVDPTDGVAAADFNADGFLDAILVNNGTTPTADDNRLCTGDGTGDFTCGTPEPGVANNSRDVAAGDIDSDGDHDFVVANDGQANRACFNDGTGSFICSDIPESTGSGSGIALGDFNVLALINSVALAEADVDNLETTTVTDACPPMDPNPVGRFHIPFRVTSSSTDTDMTNVVVEVETLDNENLLENADNGAGGVGAIYTLDGGDIDPQFCPANSYGDGVLEAQGCGEGTLSLCLATFDRFFLFVNLYATLADTAASSGAIAQNGLTNLSEDVQQAFGQGPNTAEIGGGDEETETESQAQTRAVTARSVSQTQAVTRSLATPPSATPGQNIAFLTEPLTEASGFLEGGNERLACASMDEFDSRVDTLAGSGVLGPDDASGLAELGEQIQAVIGCAGACSVGPDIAALIQDPGTSKQASRRLNNALTYVNSACDSLTDSSVTSALTMLKKALSQLEKAAKKGALVASAAGTLLAQAQSAADQKVAEAIEALGSDNKHVRKAQQHYQKGLVAPTSRKAIAEFLKAVRKADKALAKG